MRAIGERERGGESREERSRAEQQRAARTRRPFAYFTGNLRASIRQGNCKNGGVIYLSLPPWALSSFPRFPPLSTTPLHCRARARDRVNAPFLTRVAHTGKSEENSAIYPVREDKRDLSFRSELPRPPNCVIEISSRSCYLPRKESGIDVTGPTCSSFFPRGPANVRACRELYATELSMAVRREAASNRWAEFLISRVLQLVSLIECEPSNSTVGDGGPLIS